MTIKDRDRPVVSFPVDQLIPYENNAKKHSEKDVSDIVEGIQQYGFNSVMAVDKHGVIAAGHGRRLAAIQLGMKFVPVHILDDLDENQVKAYRLSDNKVTGTEYDHALEQAELEMLSETDVDMSGIGYDDRELDFLTSDLSDMNMDSIIDDLDMEVKDHTEKAKAKAEEIESDMITIGEAFGFKKVSIEMARSIGQFMGLLEEETGKKEADALSDFILPLISKS